MNTAFIIQTICGMLKIVHICLECPGLLELQRPCALLLVSSGEGSLKINKEYADLTPGRVFLLRESPPVMFDGHKLIGHLIEFQQVILHAFLLQFVSHRNKGLYNPELQLPYADLTMDSMMFLLNLIAQLNKELDEGTSSYIFMHYLFILLRHVNRQAETSAVLASGKESRLLHLMMLIEENYKTCRKTSLYASRIGMTDRQLNAFSYKLFGKRFFSVLIERVMAEADLLLMENRMSVKEIAYELGFSHHGHFNTYYTRIKGMSPVAYRADLTKK